MLETSSETVSETVSPVVLRQKDETSPPFRGCLIVSRTQVWDGVSPSLPNHSRGQKGRFSSPRLATASRARKPGLAISLQTGEP
jgi:hypothetical protein